MLRKDYSGKRYKLFMFILGLSMSFGEQFNNRLPHASQMFVIIGTLVTCIFFLIWMTGEKKITIYGGEYKYYLSLILFLFVLLSFKLLFVKGALDGNSYLEYYKQVIFMIIGFSVFSIIKKNEQLSYALVEGFIIGFLLMLPAGEYGLFDNTKRLMGTYINPNAYATDCCMAAFCALYLLKNKKLKFIKITIAVISMVLLLLTGTRGALIGIIISVCILVVRSKRTRRKIAIITVGISAAVILSILMSGGDNPLYNRFFSSDRTAAANFRLTIWGKYIQNMNIYFWTGMKVSDFGLIYKKSPHNTTLGIFVRYGIAAFVLYVFYIYKMLKKSFIMVLNKSLTWIEKILPCMFITSFIAGFTTENLTSRSTYIIMALCMAEYYRKNQSVIKS